MRGSSRIELVARPDSTGKAPKTDELRLETEVVNELRDFDSPLISETNVKKPLAGSETQLAIAKGRS